MNKIFPADFFNPKYQSKREKAVMDGGIL